MPKQFLSINEAAAKLGVSTKTLRRWEEKGIISPKRTVGNQRRYSLADIEKADKQSLTINEAAQRLGLSAKTLRRWEEKGIIAPERTSGNQRRYAVAEIEKLKDKNPKAIVTTRIKKQAVKDISSLEKERFFDIASVKVTHEPRIRPVVTDFNPVVSRPAVIASDNKAIFTTNEIDLSSTTSRNNKYKFINKYLLNKQSAAWGGAFLSIIAALLFINNFSHVSIPVKLLSLLPYFNNTDTTRKSKVTSGNEVLATQTQKKDYAMRVSIPAEFFSTASVSGELTAPNILYSVVAGNNITISGDKQNPTISAAIDTGIGLTFTNGTLTNADPGSSQKIFGKIKVGSDTISAGSNTDTFELAAGSNVSLSTDTSNKKITISSTASSGSSGIDVLEGGTAVSNPATKLNFLAGDFNVSESPPGQANVQLASTLTSVTGVAGNFAVGGSLTVGSDTISDITGNGLAVSSNTLAINLTTSGTTGLTSSNSGLEVGSAGLTLLKGCADNEILKYTDAGGWACSPDAGAGAAVGGTGAQNQIAFWTNATTISGSNNFYWDSANEKFGIGTSGAPDGKIEVTGAAKGKALAILNETGDQNILTASASGITQLNLDRSGNLAIEGAISDLSNTALTVNDDLKVVGNHIIDSGNTTRITLGATNTITGSNLTLSGTSTLDATSLTALNGGATAISFTDFSVNGTTGSVTIDNPSNTGAVTVEGTSLNINSLNFVAGGSITTAAGNDLTLSPGGSHVLLSSSSTLNVGGAAGTAYNFFANSTAGATLPATNKDLYIQGALEVDGQTRLGNITYTWPGSIGGNNYLLQTQTDGTLAWINSTTLGTNYWDQLNGALTPKIETQDLLLGAQATSSAKFAFINVAGGTPTATISGTGNNALSFNGNGTISTTNRQSLTLGNTATGDLNFVVGNNNHLTINGTAGISVSASCVTTINGIVTAGVSCPAVAANDIWQTGNGTIFEGNTTQDLLIGGTATSSALFAVTGVAGNSPTATLSATTNNNGLSLSASNSTIQSLNRGTLTLGGSTTGNIILSGRNGSSNSIYLQGYDCSAFSNSGKLTVDATGLIQCANDNSAAGGGTLNIKEGGSTIVTSATDMNFAASDFNITAESGTQGGVAIDYGNSGITRRNNAEVIGGQWSFLSDILAGGTSTSSAKFAVLNMMGAGTPTATLSAGLTGGAYLTAAGQLQSTANQTLNLGGDSTGNIVLSPKNGSGDVRINGTTTLNGLTYTWPGSQTNGYILQTNGSGTLSWVDSNSLTASYWDRLNGALYPKNAESNDFLLGSTATNSAEFAVTGISAGTPVATLSATTNSNGISLSASNATIQSLNKGTLTFGGTTTGDIVLGTDATQRTITIGNTTSGTSLNLNTGTGGINLGDNANIKTIDIGGVANDGTDTINIATNGTTNHDVIAIGNNNAATTLALTGGTAWSIATSGLGTFSQVNVDSLTLNNTSLSSTGDLTLDATGGDVVSSDRFTIGSQTATTLGTLDVQALSGTLSVATISGKTSFASLVIDNSGAGDIFTASAAGRQRLTLTNAGELRMYDADASNYTGFKTPSNITSNAVYTLPTALPASNNYVLVSQNDGTLSWVDAGTLPSVNYWDLTNGAIYPKNADTYDLLLGSTATNSAEFAVTGISAGSPVATLSAITNNTGLSLNASSATIQSLNKGTLTIGGATTGNIVLDAGSNLITLSDPTSLTSTLTVAGTTNLNGNVVLGDTITDNITFTGRVAQDADLIPITTTGTNDLGSASLPWDNLYVGTVTQNGSTLGATYAPINANFITVTANGTLTGETGIDALTTAISTTSTLNVDSPSTLNAVTLDPNANLILSAGTGKLGIGTSSPLSALDVRGNSGTTSVATISGTTSFASLVVDNTGVGDIFTASTGGVSKFTVQNNGTIVDSNYTTAGGIFYGTSTGTFALSSAGQAGQVLQSNGAGAPTWIATSTLNFWQKNLGALAPANITDDLLLGSTSTASARFAFTNAVGPGTPTASIAAITTNNALSLDANGNIGTTNKQTLNLGTTSTGNINLVVGTGNNLTINGVAGADVAVATCVTTNKGIVTGTGSCTSPSNIYLWSTSSNNTAIIEGNTTQDLLLGGIATASAKFAVLNIAGSLTPIASLSAGVPGGTYLTADGILQTTAYQQLTVGGSSTGNVSISAKGGSGTLALSVGALTINGSTGITSVSPTCVSFTNGIVTGSSNCGAGQGGNTWTFNTTDGTTYPINSTMDLLIGGVSTNSAKFAVINVAGGTPVASISAGTAGAAFLTADGNLQTTARQSLTLGGGNTGNVVLSGATTGIIHSNGSGVLSSSAINLAGGATEVSGILPIANGGSPFEQNGSGAITERITTQDLLLGGTATTSAKFAFTGVAGSSTPIASISANPATGTANGLVLSGTGTIQSLNKNTLTLGGSTTGDIVLSGFATGIIHSTNGVLSSSAVNLANSDVTGILTIANGGSPFEQTNNGAITERITTQDLLLGGTATSSARFAVINIAGGTPTASLSAAAGGTYLTAAGALQTTNNQSLTIGGATTGNLTFSPLNGTGFSSFNGSLGLNTARLLGSLDVRPNLTNGGTIAVASISGKTSLASLVVDNSGVGDIFTASSSGLSRFVIAQNGNVGVGTTTPTDLLDVENNGDTYLKAVATGGSGQNAGIKLQRGTASDGFSDWNIYNSSSNGNLTFDMSDTGTTSTILKLLSNTSNAIANIAGQTCTGCTDYSSLEVTSAGGGVTAGQERPMQLQPNGGTYGVVSIGVGGNNNPLATLDVRGNLGTTPFASISGKSSFAGLIVDNKGVGDIFTASSAGRTRFTIGQTGNLQFTGNTNFLTTLTSAATAARTITFPDATGTICLSSNNCAAEAIWNTNASGAIVEGNTTMDLLLGGVATTSSKFAFTGVAGSSTPIASISANPASGTTTGIVLNGNGNIQGLNKNTLTLGGTSTGNIAIENPISSSTNIVSFTPATEVQIKNHFVAGSNTGSILYNSISNSANSSHGFNANNDLYIEGRLEVDNTIFADGNIDGGQFFWDNTNDRLGVGIASNLLGTLDVRTTSATLPTATISGRTTSAGLIVDNTMGDLFTASSSGLNRFVIKQNGNIGIGATLPTAQLQINQTTGATSAFILNAASNNFGDPSIFRIIDNNGTDRINYDNLIHQTAIGGGNKSIWNSAGLIAYTDDSTATALRIGGAANAAQTGNVFEIYDSYNNSSAALGTLKFAINPSGTISTASISANTSFAAMVVNNSGSGDLFTASSSGLSRFVINNNGNVGIGTVLPSAQLHIVSSANPIALLERSSVSNSSIQYKNTSFSFYAGLSSGGNFNLKVADSDVGTSPLFTFTKNGLVGFNASTNPIATLDVRGNPTNGGTISIASFSGQTSFAGLVADNSGSGDIFTASDTGKTVFTVAQDRVQIGTGSATGAGGAETPELLSLDSKGSTGDPANGRQGDMYYNTVDEKFRCYQATGWTDCIATSASEYMSAEMRNIQTANIAINDHLKFETATASGSVITLDTTTNYTNGAGASIGRFTLQGGRTYRLQATIPYAIFSSGTALDYSWYDVTNGKILGNAGGLESTNATANDMHTSYADTIFSPTSTTVVELRFVAVGTVTQIGYLSGNQQLSPSAFIQVISGAQSVSASEYLRAELNTTQASNLSTNDHVKYDSVQAFSGNSITLDSSTAYTSGAGASVGRFTLKAGKTYRLIGKVAPAYGSADSAAGFQWYNITAGSAIGSAAYNNSVSRTDTSSNSDWAEAIITPTTTTVVELRISIQIGTLVDVFSTGTGTSAFIEVLSDGTKVAQFTGATSAADGAIGYVPAPSAGQQGSLLLGNGTWTAATNVAIGTTLTQPIASFSAATSFAGLVVNNNGSGDLFTASSSGLNRFVIKQNGNVGIGTTNPTGLFQVNDVTAGTARMFLDSGGALGLGTSSPLGHVNIVDTRSAVTAGADNLSLWLRQNIAVNGLGVGIGFTDSTSTTEVGAKILHIRTGGNSQGDLAFYTKPTTLSGDLTTEKLRITGAGTIGINFGTPSATLDVRGNLVDNSVAGTTPIASISGKTSFASLVVDNSGAGDIFTASSSGLNRFVITQAGNVGIGTTAPAANLDIVQKNAGGPGLYIRSLNAGLFDAYAFRIDDSSGNLAVGYHDEIQQLYITGSNTFYNTSALLVRSNSNGGVALRVEGQSASQTFDTFQVYNTTSGRLNFAVNGLGTKATATISANTSFAGLVVDNSGRGDLFTASSSGNTRFVINNNGNVGIGDTLPQTAMQLCSSCVLQIGRNTDSLYTQLDNNDLVFNRNNNAYVENANTGASAVLALGTGNISSNGHGISIQDSTVGINNNLNVNGTNLATLDVRGISGTLPIASLSAQTSFAGLVVDNKGRGDIFTASSSGKSRFTIMQNGNILVGNPSQTGNRLNFDESGTGGNGILMERNDGSYNSTNATFGISSNGGNSGLRFEMSNNDGGAYTDTLFLADNAKVGVGTTAPLYKLDVLDSQSATAAAQIWNNADSGGGNSGKCTPGTNCRIGLNIKMGLSTSVNPGVLDRFINFMAGNGRTVGKITGSGNGAGAGVIYDTAGADFAEYFKKADASEDLPFGSIVCSTPNGITKCTPANNNILGVISDTAGFTGRDEHEGDPDYILVGLVGQVPTHLSTENGSIHVGDYLTWSSTPGYAAKAIKAGAIIGRAQEYFDGSDPEKRVWITVQPSWYDPDVYLTDTGNIALFEQPNAPQLDGTSLFGVTNNGENVQRIGVFSDAVVGNLKTGSLDVQSLSLGGQNLNDTLLGLQNGFASASAGFATPLADLQTQVSSLSDRVASLEAILTASNSALFTNNLGGFTASSGAELSLDKLNVNGSIISDSLNVLSYATINELSVTGSIRTGVLTINGQSGTGGASISTLNGDLKLQDQGFGGIDILNGLVTVDTSGNIQSAGEITAKKFNVDTTDVSAASAGTGTILSGTKTTIINTTAVTANSIIQVTFTGDYAPATRYWIKAKTAGSSFTIQLDQPVVANSKFTWFIVN